MNKAGRGDKWTLYALCWDRWDKCSNHAGFKVGPPQQGAAKRGATPPTDPYAGVATQHRNALDLETLIGALTGPEAAKLGTMGAGVTTWRKQDAYSA
jgi:hypothetical protein